jgi:hypothetical protein
MAASGPTICSTGSARRPHRRIVDACSPLRLPGFASYTRHGDGNRSLSVRGAHSAQDFLDLNEPERRPLPAPHLACALTSAARPQLTDTTRDLAEITLQAYAGRRSSPSRKRK